MPTTNERGLGPLARLLELLAAIRWEAQFKLAKCCMRVSTTISDLGVFLAANLPFWLGIGAAQKGAG